MAKSVPLIDLARQAVSQADQAARFVLKRQTAPPWPKPLDPSSTNLMPAPGAPLHWRSS